MDGIYICVELGWLANLYIDIVSRNITPPGVLVRPLYSLLCCLFHLTCFYIVFFSMSLSYLILDVFMQKCWEPPSCTSFSFFIVILNEFCSSLAHSSGVDIILFGKWYIQLNTIIYFNIRLSNLNFLKVCQLKKKCAIFWTLQRFINILLDWQVWWCADFFIQRFTLINMNKNYKCYKWLSYLFNIYLNLVSTYEV